MSVPQNIETGEISPRTLLLGVYAPGNSVTYPEDYFDEFVSLVTTLGIEYDQTYFTKLRSVDKAHLLTKGKLEELLALVEESSIERIVCSERLSPLQHRRLEDVTGTTVIDRAQLILNIFKESATSAEGRIQVEMAEIQVLQSRMAGQGQEFAQQLGLVGGKGPGETYKEVTKRFLARKFHVARQKLAALSRARATQRKRRLLSSFRQVALVGYTNAGKSSLLNRLTQSEVLVEDKLFATLDTTTRELYVKEGVKVLISDTVGFISQLPHQLVEAFKSTLEEVRFADLLLHVVDLSNHGWEDQIAVVKKTLEELEAADKPVVYIFNKADAISDDRLVVLKRDFAKYEPYLILSAHDKESKHQIIDKIASWISLGH